MAEIAQGRRLWLARVPTTRCPSSPTSMPPSSNATDWLADAEIKISYAVLDYARDARGGRIEPARISRQSRSHARFAQSLRSDRVRSPSAPIPPPICAASSPTSRNSRRCRQKLIELRGGKAETPKPAIVKFPTVRCSSSASSTSRSRCSASGSTSPRNRTERRSRRSSTNTVPRRVSASNSLTASMPDGVVGAGTRRLLNAAAAAARGGSPAQDQADPASIWSAGAGCRTTSASST